MTLARVDERLRSPLPGVPDVEWSLFVLLMKGERMDGISPAHHLGLFNVSYLRLRDLGLARNVRQTEIGGRRVWSGTFLPPLTRDQFLGSPALQYQVFCRDMADRFALVGSHVGADIDGTKATASGLLAAAKLAGRRGFQTWVSKADERRRFATTTEAFHVANGIF